MTSVLLFFGGCAIGMTAMLLVLSAKSVYLQNKIDTLEEKLIKLRKNKRK